MRAIDFKKKVVLIEKSVLGGAGIHHGALTSKTWWELSRESYSLRKHSSALNISEPKLWQQPFGINQLQVYFSGNKSS